LGLVWGRLALLGPYLGLSSAPRFSSDGFTCRSCSRCACILKIIQSWHRLVWRYWAGLGVPGPLARSTWTLVRSLLASLVRRWSGRRSTWATGSVYLVLTRSILDPGPVYFGLGLVYLSTWAPGPVYSGPGPIYFGRGPAHLGLGPVYLDPWSGLLDLLSYLLGQRPCPLGLGPVYLGPWPALLGPCPGLLGPRIWRAGREPGGPNCLEQILGL